MSNRARSRIPAGSSPHVATIARMSSVTAGRTARWAVPMVLLIPAFTNLTVSSEVGDLWPAALWAWAMDTSRRDNVDALKYPSRLGRSGTWR